MARLRSSMERLAMPGHDFDPGELIKCISDLVRLDRDWIPRGEGTSMYIRPAVISTHPYLGLAAPDELLLYVITCPVGSYFDDKKKKGENKGKASSAASSSSAGGVRLTADVPHVRAWPGGVGDAKV